MGNNNIWNEMERGMEVRGEKIQGGFELQYEAERCTKPKFLNMSQHLSRHSTDGSQSSK